MSFEDVIGTQLSVSDQSPPPSPVFQARARGKKRSSSIEEPEETGRNIRCKVWNIPLFCVYLVLEPSPIYTNTFLT